MTYETRTVPENTLAFIRIYDRQERLLIELWGTTQVVVDLDWQIACESVQNPRSNYARAERIWTHHSGRFGQIDRCP